VRNYINSLTQTSCFKSLTIIERPYNYYLERNIIEGINEVFQKHDKVIVLEDDILTSPYYLEYMNRAFELYEDEPKVMHVSGFTNLDIINENPELYNSENETYFTMHMAGWGWGTWRNRWHSHFKHFTSRTEALEGLKEDDLNIIQYDGVFPCLKSLDKDPIPWDVCWELEIYRAKGLCITPAYTMVRNIGLNNGTHFRSFKLLQSYNYDREPLNRPLHITYCSPILQSEYEELFKEAIRDWGIRYTVLGKIVRCVYKCIKK